VGRTPWSAADAHVGLFGDLERFPEERFLGDPRGPGGPPTKGETCAILSVSSPTSVISKAGEDTHADTRLPPGVLRFSRWLCDSVVNLSLGEHRASVPLRSFQLTTGSLP